MVRLAIALALALLVAACGNGPQEWSRPYEGYLPGTEIDRFAAVLVVDKRTGRPIQGAGLRAHPEMELGPDGWAPLRAETTTDEFGLAWIPRFEGEGDFHWVVDAEGHAPTEKYGTRLSEVVELVPGTDRFGRILDVYGRPVPGIRVEYKEGCAHSPALRSTVTDRQGSFTLRCIREGGDVPLEGRALRAEYGGGLALSVAGEPLAEFHGLPGHEVAGLVLDAAGNPAAGARLHGYTSGRGPTTAAGRDGRFTLYGTERENMLAVYHQTTFEEFDLSDYRQDGPVVLQLGQKARELDTVEVDVEVTGAVSGKPCDLALVHFVRASDGRRFSGRSEDGVAWVELPPGPYLLSAGAPDERYVAEARQVEVEPRAGQRFALRVEEQPRLLVVVEDLPEDTDSLLIHSGDCFGTDVHVQPERLPRDPVYLPRAAEASVVTGAWGRRKVFPVASAAGGVRRVVLDWGRERPRQVRFRTLPKCVAGIRILGERSFLREDKGRGDTGDGDDEDAAVLDTWARGRVTLRFRLDWGETHDQLVDLPQDPGGVLRLEKPDLPPARPRRKITVVHPDGSPADVLACDVFPAAPWVNDREDMTGLPGAHFRIVGPSPEHGHRVTRYGRLAGPGPWTVRLGAAALRVALTLEDSERKSCALYVDGDLFELDPGETTAVLGLVAGPHRILVGAEGHVGRAMRVVLKEAETRTISVRLPRRPGR